MPNFRCKFCHQRTQRRDRICPVHRDSLRGHRVNKAASGKRVRLRRKTRPVIDQLAPPHPQLKLNPPGQPLADQSHQEGQAASVADQSHEEGQAASVAPQSQQQCQQCQLLQAEVGDLRGMAANYEAKWKDALNQLASMQQRLASAEDRADWLQAAMRSGSLPPPSVQADAHE